jgi:hypothetical protein
MTSASLADEIGDVIAKLCGCWTRLDLQAIAELWDREDPGIFLLPQEIEQPLVGWAALETYLSKARVRLQAASMRTWNLNARLIGPDLAVALYEMHWNGQMIGVTRPIGVDSRATAVLRRRNGTWRICHYVEAPVAFSLRLQQTYLDAVDADFAQRIGWQGQKGERLWPDGTPL